MRGAMARLQATITITTNKQSVNNYNYYINKIHNLPLPTYLPPKVHHTNKQTHRHTDNNSPCVYKHQQKTLYIHTCIYLYIIILTHNIQTTHSTLLLYKYILHLKTHTYSHLTNTRKHMNVKNPPI